MFLVIISMLILVISSIALYLYFNTPVDCSVGEWSACDNNGNQSRKILIHPKNGGTECGNLTQDCIVDISGQWNMHNGGHDGIVSLISIDNTTWSVNKLSGGDGIISGKDIKYIKGTGYVYNSSTTLNFSDSSLRRLVNSDNIGLWLYR